LHFSCLSYRYQLANVSAQYFDIRVELAGSDPVSGSRFANSNSLAGQGIVLSDLFLELGLALRQDAFLNLSFAQGHK